MDGDETTESLEHEVEFFNIMEVSSVVFHNWITFYNNIIIILLLSFLDIWQFISTSRHYVI